MSSSHKKDLTTPVALKGAGDPVTGDTVIIPPDCEELLLAVTTDDTVSGVVDATLEVSVDGVNWTTAKTATLGLAAIPAQIAIGTITYPATNAAAGTVVCSISYSGGNLDVNPTYILELTGDDADQYRLNNTTQTQTGDTLTGVVFGDIVRLEVYNDDNSGGSYAFNYTATGYYHDDVNIKVTESSNNLEDDLTVDDTDDATEGIWKHAPATLTKTNLVASLVGDATVATFVCDLTPAGGPTGGGPTPTYSLALSGDNAAKYRLKNHTTGLTGAAGATLAGIVLGNSVKLEVGELFDYAEATTHNVTITNTESVHDMTAATSITNLTVYATVTYANEKYFKRTDDGRNWWTDDGTTAGGSFANMGTNTNGIPDLQDAWTFTSWHRFDTDECPTGPSYPTSFSFSDASETTRWTLFWYYYGYGTNAFRLNLDFQIKTPTLGQISWVTSPTSINFWEDAGGGAGHVPASNTWWNLTFSKKATTTGAFTAGDIKIYINGVDYTGTPPSETWHLEDISDPGDWNGTFWQWNGLESDLYALDNLQVDEAAVWDRQLTDAEVLAIWNAGGANGWEDLNTDSVGDTDEDLTSGMIQYWRFGDGAHKDTDAPDTFEKIHDVSSNDDGVDLEIVGYDGTADDMIKDH